MKEYEEESKDSSYCKDDDNVRHVDGQLATNTKSDSRTICVLIVQINLKLKLF